ncbi:hypothetical protein GGQ68_002977 [Sagittula marina]|uniref:Uncharacterized protein n=1 Tax=Sagittula marina TaxID=943940 RepID=A0A7W6DPX0_9RHOB|nr:hypothetical protein [Sagittula marina]MBB3986634.1 hypothetical protein [Sagittula marina]
MSHPKTAAAHWTAEFPQLRAPDPRLEILRYELMYAEEGHSLTRLRTQLEKALNRPIEIALPGDESRSFDERWMMAVFDALKTLDLRWYQFLLRSRMEAGDAARVHFALTQAQVWLEARL